MEGLQAVEGPVETLGYRRKGGRDEDHFDLVSPDKREGLRLLRTSRQGEKA